MIVVLVFICCCNLQTAFSQGLPKTTRTIALLHCYCNQKKISYFVAIFSRTPISKNVTAGSIVQFHCATHHDTVSLTLTGVAEATTESKTMMISLTFTATTELNGTSVLCLSGGIAPNDTGVYVNSTARLLVQGETSKTLSIDS